MGKVQTQLGPGAQEIGGFWFSAVDALVNAATRVACSKGEEKE